MFVVFPQFLFNALVVVNIVASFLFLRFIQYAIRQEGYVILRTNDTIAGIIIWARDICFDMYSLAIGIEGYDPRIIEPEAIGF